MTTPTTNQLMSVIYAWERWADSIEQRQSFPMPGDIWENCARIFRSCAIDVRVLLDIHTDTKFAVLLSDVGHGTSDADISAMAGLKFAEVSAVRELDFVGIAEISRFGDGHVGVVGIFASRALCRTVRHATSIR